MPVGVYFVALAYYSQPTERLSFYHMGDPSLPVTAKLDGKLGAMVTACVSKDRMVKIWVVIE